MLWRMQRQVELCRCCAGLSVQVIFVSSDNEAEEFDEYFGEMPWCVLAWVGVARPARGRWRNARPAGAPRAAGQHVCDVHHVPAHCYRRASVPFDATAVREGLSEKYEVQGIPRVVVLNAATGAIVNDDARAIITAKKKLAGVFTA